MFVPPKIASTLLPLLLEMWSRVRKGVILLLALLTLRDDNDPPPPGIRGRGRLLLLQELEEVADSWSFKLLVFKDSCDACFWRENTRDATTPPRRLISSRSSISFFRLARRFSSIKISSWSSSFLLSSLLVPFFIPREGWHKETTKN